MVRRVDGGVVRIPPVLHVARGIQTLAPSDTTSAQTPSSFRHPPHTSFLFPITLFLGLGGADGHSWSCLCQLRPQHPAAPSACPLSVQPTPPPPTALRRPLWSLNPRPVSGPGIQNSSIIRALSRVASGVPGHIKKRLT